MARHLSRTGRSALTRALQSGYVGAGSSVSTTAARALCTQAAPLHSNAWQEQQQHWTKTYVAAGALFAASAAAAGTTTIALAESTPSLDLPKIREAIEGVIEENEDMGPTLVRLAWHASGTYDKATNTGGSEGATMRFAPEAEFGANAGLGLARAALEPIKKAYPEMSYADLWTLAGCVAIQYMGGPAIGWRSGRVDKPDGSFCPPDGRLPDGDKGSISGTIQHVRDIFGRMGFNDQEMVALIGAHALGRCYPTRSGYSGPWTRAPTTFSNEYYRELLENTWTLKQWDGPDQFEDPSGDLMMLPADMALIWDPKFRKITKMYADDGEKFEKDFASAFQKLTELGVDAFAKSSKPWWSPF